MALPEFEQMYEVPKQSITGEFRWETVKRVEDGQKSSPVAKQIGIAEQRLLNWH